MRRRNENRNNWKPKFDFTYASSFVIGMLWSGLTCFPHCSGAQDTISFSYKSYGLERDINNIIQNEGHLDDFYESLFQLKKGLPMKVNIVHIGDSHIQADFLTSPVRRNFQRQFGNAGRGLIVPGR